MTTTRAKTRITKLAAAMLLVGGLLIGSATATAASVNTRQVEPLGGGGGSGLAFARHPLTLLLEDQPTTIGVWRGGHYVGFLPE